MLNERYMIDGNPEAKGTLYSYTTVFSPIHELEEFSPYIIGLVKLESGKMLLAQLTDCTEEELSIGMEMEMVVRKIREKGPRGLILYGYKFRPAKEL